MIPRNHWEHHTKGCGTLSRGCVPTCPKRIYEETNKWTGPSRISVFLGRIANAIKELVGF